MSEFIQSIMRLPTSQQIQIAMLSKHLTYKKLGELVAKEIRPEKPFSVAQMRHVVLGQTTGEAADKQWRTICEILGI
ncbi:hypothetical protein ATX69_02425 [Oenococcus oeni]|uniref:hypothetical protein n=1 Tax=Oenococcus oeni TaxID=1247 RepID=UPI0008F96D11|nr:hypothetical protein [Oenococcus oeni]OIM34178.1 hypothetical protein ATX69_02425 [Oenococcus oeni]